MGKNRLRRSPFLRGSEIIPFCGGKPFQAYSWLYHSQGGGDTLAGDPEISAEGVNVETEGNYEPDNSEFGQTCKQGRTPGEALK